LFLSIVNKIGLGLTHLCSLVQPKINRCINLTAKRENTTVKFKLKQNTRLPRICVNLIYGGENQT
jgi:hypothetical protein